MKPTLYEFSRDNTLMVPETLYDMADARTLLRDNDASIIYKHMREDLVAIEFYTNMPCLVFVSGGEETFTFPNDKTITLNKNEFLLLPKNLYVISDFYKKGGPLKATLFFFDCRIIEEFLVTQPQKQEHDGVEVQPYHGVANNSQVEFISALNRVYPAGGQSSALARLKLMELLHLIYGSEHGGELWLFLKGVNEPVGRRNIKHIMRQYCLNKLDVADFARISGRSLSTFNREFRSLYNMSPGQWLTDVRMQHAQKLVHEGSQSITDIAMTIGYADTSHFIRLYKEKFGRTPKQDQKNNN